MDRLFTSAQRKHLYLSANGRCEKCGDVLNAGWHAHHKRRHADGGVTEITNGMALCERCHVLMHRRVGVVEPRDWQIAALDKFEEHRAKCFMLDATPGSGKTLFSAFCFNNLVKRNIVDFAIIIVPTIVLKGDAEAGFLGEWNKASVQITTVLKDKQGCPSEFRGGVITYSQLPNIVSTLEVWASNGVRLFLVFDEIHHAAENHWASAAERLERCSEKVFSMTGTPFRGDGRRISFVEYDSDGLTKSDFKYSYRQAVRDFVCRPVQFITDDGIAEFVSHQEQDQVKISEASTDEEVRNAANTIFRADSAWLRTFVERADISLDDYRVSDPDAGALVVCRPGFDDKDERYLHQIGRLIKDATSDAAEIISYDDVEANIKIEKFRKSSQRWICAVRKISEGVDIKRLRVLVMAMRPTTELLFRQIIGRAVRSQNKTRTEYATIYIPKFPQLQEWAYRISGEAEAGLQDKDDQEDREIGERKPSSFVALSSSHEEGGAISDYGDEYTAAEINSAERNKRDDPQLADIPVTKIAYLRRKLGVTADPIEPTTKPLQIEKKEIRIKINKFVKRLAIRRNPEQPDFGRVWFDLHRRTGAKNIDDLMDNYSIDVMRQSLALIYAWLGEDNV